MAECRSLIEFLRAFEHHRRAADTSACSRSKRASSPRPTACDNSPMAAVDALVLLAVLAALGFLVIPYVKLLLVEMGAVLHPAASCLSAAAFFGAAVAVAAAVVAWELLGHHARKCGKPRCRGLKKAVEFDIQLETEECVRRLRRSRCRGRAADGARGRAPRARGGARGRAPRARGGSQEDGATQRPHRAHLPRTMRVPQGQDGGVGCAGSRSRVVNTPEASHPMARRYK
uniref:Uncharacterized protein n=1 Tax=Arundo donax TaxID=35708 RepID=A0A0A9C6M5_ARUDO